jgi:23S rRNA pseudouridine1911/1915/1917 synthase
MIKPTEGVINVPIGRSRLDRKKMSTFKFGGKTAITYYKTLENFCGGLFSIIECKLETGRTHQIRVHLSHIRHSIIGDQTYGKNSRKIHGCPDALKEPLTAMRHQALHSFHISFNLLDLRKQVAQVCLRK